MSSFKNNLIIHRAIFFASLFVLLSLSLASCSEKLIPLDVVGFNHTDRDIGYFSVDDSGGRYLGKHEGGGAVCCIGVPRQYKSGMKVRVAWSGKEIGPDQERIVEVPPYIPDDIGEFAVHFLKNGDVKVFVTNYGLGHPKSPLKGEEAKM